MGVGRNRHTTIEPTHLTDPDCLSCIIYVNVIRKCNHKYCVARCSDAIAPSASVSVCSVFAYTTPKCNSSRSRGLFIIQFSLFEFFLGSRACQRARLAQSLVFHAICRAQANKRYLVHFRAPKKAFNELVCGLSPNGAVLGPHPSVSSPTRRAALGYIIIFNMTLDKQCTP